ncbi:MAG TPA: hypothetical protein PKE45_01160 [Caldilineaceae bacterium]|nr:hypothetical protein [Caldilineaceae bacterium]
MPNEVPWLAAEPNTASVLATFPDPLRALAAAEFPAIVLRGAYDPAHCAGLIRRFVGWGLMRDPTLPNAADQRKRIDIGTSLGNRGHDREAFLTHAQSTLELFPHLFDGFADPVQTLYAALQALALDKQVKTAREPDGRLYGPAIFRIHYESHSYPPHIDSVKWREARTNYDVYRFEHQFAGILCLQNSRHGERVAQTIVHQCLWTPEIQPHLAGNTFPEYAAAHGVGQYRVEPARGALYFFNPRCIHEIPPLDGDDPRIVLAVFIGYSPDDNEIYVWS